MPQIDFTTFFIISIYVYLSFFGAFYFSIINFFSVIVIWLKIDLKILILSYLFFYSTLKILILLNKKVFLLIY